MPLSNTDPVGPGGTARAGGWLQVPGCREQQEGRLWAPASQRGAQTTVLRGTGSARKEARCYSNASARLRLKPGLGSRLGSLESPWLEGPARSPRPRRPMGSRQSP